MYLFKVHDYMTVKSKIGIALVGIIKSILDS